MADDANDEGGAAPKRRGRRGPDQATLGFAQRVMKAIEADESIPTTTRGRNSELAKRTNRFLDGEEITPESVRRWIAGQSYPRESNLIALARALEVNWTWLAYGKGEATSAESIGGRMGTMLSSDVTPERYIVPTLVVAGGGRLIDVPGDGPVHARVRIMGGEYALRGVIGSLEGDVVTFDVPAISDETVTLGIVPAGTFSFRVFEIPVDLSDKRLTFSLKEKTPPIREIKDFAHRL